MNSLALPALLALLDRFGFKLIVWWAHAFRAKECGTTNTKMEPSLHTKYNSCWYGQECLEVLLTHLLPSTSVVSSVTSNHIYIGEVLLTSEEHHFVVICDETHAYILNTYGGVNELRIIELGIEQFNASIGGVGDAIVFEEVFSFAPLREGEVLEVNLQEYPLILPSTLEVLRFVDVIGDELRNVEDKRQLDVLREKIASSSSSS